MNKNIPLVLEELTEAKEVLDKFIGDPKNLSQIAKAADLLSSCLKSKGKLFSCGNGGSHCDAMHFAEELTGKFREERQPFPAIAIADPSHITCAANDYGFKSIFSRYVEALGGENDGLVAISTSGNSENIIEAVKVAKKKGMKVVALTGKSGGQLADMVDIEIRVPHTGYSDRIQEVHIKVIHIMILLIEKNMA